MTRSDRSCSGYSDLLKLAEQYSAVDDFAAAVAIIQVAVRNVFPGNGLFASPQVERLLVDIGRRLPAKTPLPAHQRTLGSRRRVLHVLTYAQPVGGDSRFAWRWIQQDRSSQHSVAITAQADVQYDIPGPLRAASETSGGFVRALTAPTSKPLEQALELRALCQQADVVVLHLYPYDVIPILALATGCEAVKTLFVNHADHTFWVGASVAHNVVHLRTQSQQFLIERRGLDPAQSSLLPIPLVRASTKTSREEAKRALGLNSNVLVLLTIATPFKYSFPGQIGFLELVTPILRELSNVTLLAIGPRPEGSWLSANRQTNGRIVALGTRWDTELFYAAADIYLDSAPFSSMTSLLEAGSHALPLLSYRLAPGLAMLGPGAPGLDETVLMADDIKSYAALLRRLITDSEFRRTNGERTQARIISKHTGENWMGSLGNVYAQVEQCVEKQCLIAESDRFLHDGLTQALTHLYGGVPFSARRLMRQFVGGLPYRSRLLISWRLCSMGFGLCFLNLLPSPLDGIVHTLARAGKRLGLGFLRLKAATFRRATGFQTALPCVKGNLS